MRKKKAKENINQRKEEKNNKIIKKMKDSVKNEQVFIDKCKEYDKDINFVDDVLITFEPLDVSAKTINGKIILNENLLKAEWDEILRYCIHELTHCLQQAAGMVGEKVDKEDYLDDKNEQEAFQTQLSYMSEQDSPEEIQEYLEQLLDHHDIEGKEREDKKKILLEDV